MSLWVQFNYRRATRFQSDLSPYWFLLGPVVVLWRVSLALEPLQPTGSRLAADSSRVPRVLVKRAQ